MAEGGLLRFVAFGRTLVGHIRQQSALRTMSTPSLLNQDVTASDFAIALCVATVIFVSRLLLNYSIRETLQKRSLRDRAKLSESVFYTCHYSVAFSFFAFVLWPNEHWIRDLNVFSNQPVIMSVLDPHPPPRSVFVDMYYLHALGFYISALAFLIAYDSRRSDYKVMVLHHVVTLTLVIVSYLYNYVRIGVIILALHDVGDVFLYLATTLHKLGYAGADTFVFGIFAVVFYVTRLVALPRLNYCVAVESLFQVSVLPSFNNWAMFFESALLHWVVFSTLLFVLVLLHCYWFSLILRMIYREVVLGRKISDEGDIRSDDESD